MSTIQFRRFTKPQFLKQIGRGLLARLFGTFAEELSVQGLTLPPIDAPDDAYFSALSRVTLSPDALPDNLIEALFKIEEMANEEGHERLRAATAEAGLDLTFSDEASFGDVAVQVYLAKPELLAEKHNEQRLIRLATFEYHGNKEGVDQTGSFASPGEATLGLLTTDFDAWFAANNRGEQTAHLEVYPIDGEFWFLIRHGDAFARTAKVDRKKTEVIHFRPAKDDVVVYSPRRDELRIHAGTKGEKELYRTAFGTRLFGDDDYFSERKTYTLEPLRTLGTDALDTTGIAGVSRIVLRELEVAYDNGHDEVVIRKSDDLFAAAADAPFERQAIPASGRLARASLDFYFADSKKPRKVQVKPSNTLKLGRHCDARVVHEWLGERGFRAATAARAMVGLAPARATTKYVEPVAMP